MLSQEITLQNNNNTSNVAMDPQKSRDIKDPEKTVPALVFAEVGNIICRLTGRKEALPWQFNLLVLALVIQLPTLILSNLLNEIEQWDALGYVWMGYIELGLSAMVIARLGVFYLFKNIRLYIIDAMEDEKDLEDLQKVLAHSWSAKKSNYLTLVFTVIWCISFSQVYSEIIGQFIGWGLFTGTIVFGLLTGPALYMEGWFFYFIIHLGRYHYRLNDASPAHSEVIYRITRTLTFLLYSFATFIAFSTVAVAVNPEEIKSLRIGSVLTLNMQPIILVALIGWIPTIIYFVGSQFSISRIITSAKWRTLKRIQDEIGILHDGDIVNKENIEAIYRLMEYHTRVRMTPNSTLSLGTGLNFINQLALPFAGIVLANIENIRKIFSP